MKFNQWPNKNKKQTCKRKWSNAMWDEDSGSQAVRTFCAKNIDLHLVVVVVPLLVLNRGVDATLACLHSFLIPSDWPSPPAWFRSQLLSPGLVTGGDVCPPSAECQRSSRTPSLFGCLVVCWLLLWPSEMCGIWPSWHLWPSQPAAALCQHLAGKNPNINQHYC